MKPLNNEAFIDESINNKLLLPVYTELREGTHRLRHVQQRLNNFANQLTHAHLFGGHPVNRQAHLKAREDLKTMQSTPGLYSDELATPALKVLTHTQVVLDYRKYFTALNKSTFWEEQGTLLSSNNVKTLRAIKSQWSTHAMYAHFTTLALGRLNESIVEMSQLIQTIELQIKNGTSYFHANIEQNNSDYLSYLNKFQQQLLLHKAQIRYELFARLNAAIDGAETPWDKLNHVLKAIDIEIPKPKHPNPELINVGVIAALCNRYEPPMGRSMNDYHIKQKTAPAIALTIVQQKNRVQWVPTLLVKFIPTKPPLFKLLQPNKQWRYDWGTRHQDQIVELLRNSRRPSDKPSWDLDSDFWKGLQSSRMQLSALSNELKLVPQRRLFSAERTLFVKAAQEFCNSLEVDVVAQQISYLERLANESQSLSWLAIQNCNYENRLDYFQTLFEDLDTQIKVYPQLTQHWIKTKNALNIKIIPENLQRPLSNLLKLWHEGNIASPEDFTKVKGQLLLTNDFSTPMLSNIQKGFLPEIKQIISEELHALNIFLKAPNSVNRCNIQRLNQAFELMNLLEIATNQQLDCPELIEVFNLNLSAFNEYQKIVRESDIDANVGSDLSVFLKQLSLRIPSVELLTHSNSIIVEEQSEVSISDLNHSDSSLLTYSLLTASCKPAASSVENLNDDSIGLAPYNKM